jgi:hypothetical protein
VTKKEFQNRMLLAYLEQLVDADLNGDKFAFSCLNIKSAISSTLAQQTYSRLFAPNKNVPHWRWTVNASYNISELDLQETRMAMLSLFEEICLTEKLYKRF